MRILETNVYNLLSSSQHQKEFKMRFIERNKKKKDQYLGKGGVILSN